MSIVIALDVNANYNVRKAAGLCALIMVCFTGYLIKTGSTFTSFDSLMGIHDDLTASSFVRAFTWVIFGTLFGAFVGAIGLPWYVAGVLLVGLCYIPYKRLW